MKVLETVQRRAVKMVENLHEKGLRSLGLFRPEQRRLKGSLMVA